MIGSSLSLKDTLNQQADIDHIEVYDEPCQLETRHRTMVNLRVLYVWFSYIVVTSTKTSELEVLRENDASSMRHVLEKKQTKKNSSTLLKDKTECSVGS